MTALSVEERSQPGPAPGDDPFLVVENLTVRFPTHDGLVQAVTDLSYTVRRGETLGIVGESGSGKSVSTQAVLGLHNPKQTRLEGSIRVDGTEIIGASDATMRKVRGNKVAMVFQDPLTALHPFYTVGHQIIEAYQVHNSVSKKVARERAIEVLNRVGIPQAQQRVDDYPHQFSGGMRQRAMIAMSLVNDPQLLIADEPTTALDVTVQAQILDLLQDLQREFNSAIILITHDLGVIAEMSDNVMVMYGGRAVEKGTVKDILQHPLMPYTWGLLTSIPEVGGAIDKRLVPIPGTPPSLLSPPSGCPFHPRCTFKDRVPGDLCSAQVPELVTGTRGPGHLKRCHLVDPESVFASRAEAQAAGAPAPETPAPEAAPETQADTPEEGAR